MNLVEFIIEESQRLHGPNNTQQLNLCKHVEQPYAVFAWIDNRFLCSG
jgi:hypothetical protein